MSMLIAAFAAVVLIGDPDGVVATARPMPELDAAETPVAAAVTSQVASHGLTTQEQIDRWLDAGPVDESPLSVGEFGAAQDDRKVHGHVEAGIGTHGYRSYGGSVSVPIGETGQLQLHYRQSEGDGWGWREDRFDPFDARRGSDRRVD